MSIKWEDRSIISASLLNPAFCGEVMRRTIKAYDNDGNGFPYALSFIILPMLLHKKTRESFPGTSNALFHLWIKDNEHILMNFPNRVTDMNEFTREALMFLLANNAISISDEGFILMCEYRRKNPTGSEIDEITDIYKKADRLGKWLKNTGSPQSIYMFLKIRP